MFALRQSTIGVAALALAAIVALAGARNLSAESTPGALSEKGLQAMLENLGMRVAVAETAKDDDRTLYEFEVERGGLTFSISASISPGQTKVWLVTGLVNIDPDRVRADGLLALMSNKRIGAARFEYLAGPKFVRLALSVDNRGITPAILREQIDELVGLAVDTKDLWSENSLMTEKP